jgi:hypothetical protein
LLKVLFSIFWTSEIKNALSELITSKGSSFAKMSEIFVKIFSTFEKLLQNEE